MVRNRNPTSTGQVGVGPRLCNYLNIGVEAGYTNLEKYKSEICVFLWRDYGSKKSNTVNYVDVCRI